METADYKELFAALAKARSEIKPARHDAENQYHRYRYTSAEAVIEECSRTLAANGLALIPQSFVFHWLDPDDAESTLMRVEAEYLLTHTSGQSLKVVRWGTAQAERGRPEDKALLVANTTMLAYLLRDLCGLSRPGADDDASARDDTDYQPRDRRPAQRRAPQANGQRNPKAPQPAAPQASEAMDDDDFRERVHQALAEKVGGDQGEMDAVLSRFLRKYDTTDLLSESVDRADLLDRLARWERRTTAA